MDGNPGDGVSRRRLLQGALAVAAAAAAAEPAHRLRAGAAGPARQRGLGPGGALLAPDSRPFPHLPPGTDTVPEIEHIVVLMMENHSFDDHLGMLGRGDGLTPGPGGAPVNYNPDPAGGYVRSFHNPNTVGYAENRITQSWDASHRCWAGGTNTGFVAACGGASMGYWTARDLPFYYSMAGTFPIGDRYFCSVMAQTYPNRRFLLAGTALGDVRTNASGISATDAPNGTILDRLDHYGISWKNYYPDVPTAALFLPNWLDNRSDGKVVKIGQFLSDAAAGTLPAFSIVDPYVDYSEEGNDISVGEAYAAAMITAVLHSPAWERTALIWTYDEHGGWYDHVPPVPAVRPDGVPPEISVPPDQPGGYDRTGFRVPVAVVSPWAKRDHVSHVVYDHTSILKLVETKWNLPAMTYRDANAHDMLDFFDFSSRRPPFGEPPLLAPARNPFVGAPPPDSAGAAGHATAVAVAGSGPPAAAVLRHPPKDADELIARHTRRSLA